MNLSEPEYEVMPVHTVRNKFKVYTNQEVEKSKLSRKLNREWSSTLKNANTRIQQTIN